MFCPLPNFISHTPPHTDNMSSLSRSPLPCRQRASNRARYSWSLSELSAHRQAVKHRATGLTQTPVIVCHVGLPTVMNRHFTSGDYLSCVQCVWVFSGAQRIPKGMEVSTKMKHMFVYRKSSFFERAKVRDCASGMLSRSALPRSHVTL